MNKFKGDLWVEWFRERIVEMKAAQLLWSVYNWGHTRQTNRRHVDISEDYRCGKIL